MSSLIAVLLVVALVLLLLAAFGVVHSRVNFLPLALAFVVLAYLLVKPPFS